MQTIDLRKDAEAFCSGLECAIKSIVSEKLATLSALEIGYSCDQSGWIFIHADQRPKHERDGQWTTQIDEDKCLEFNHWIEAIESRFEGEEFTVIKHDGSRFIVPALDLDAEVNDDGDEGEGDPFALAVGEMILDVLMRAKGDGLFTQLASLGPIQLDIEDFNGSWGWPEYDELGKTNLV